jgi:hypothetical protein
MRKSRPMLLVDGEAHLMGDGVVVSMQKDEYGKVHSVAHTEADLEALLAAVRAG